MTIKNLLVLLRHGESLWNLENRFTGWTDVDLTKNGENEAKTAGKLLKERLFDFDLVFTSLLKRANRTMQICLDEMEISQINKQEDWRLNERHYGALQGLNKTETAQKYGDKQVLLWRRSYDISPPKLEFNDKRHPKFDIKYSQLGKNELPSGECLKDTVKRVIQLWKNDIAPKILSGQKILIVAHGNSLRALVKLLDIKLNAIKHYYLGDSIEIEQRIAKIKAQGKSN